MKYLMAYLANCKFHSRNKCCVVYGTNGGLYKIVDTSRRDLINKWYLYINCEL